MITLDYVIYDCIANGFLLIFAILAAKNIRFAWIMVLLSLAIKSFIYGKYGMLTSSIYLSAQIVASILAGVIWLRNPQYFKPNKRKALLGTITCIIILTAWIFLMYKYINPSVLDYSVLFGFEYLCYMLFVVGSILVAFRLAIGLLFISVELISYAVNYANSAILIPGSGAPDYIQSFIVYYWLSAVFLLVAGITLVVSYTKVKRSY